MAASTAAVAEHRTADAQVNVRMDSKLKRAGDKGLAKAGFTPSQAVRELWTFAAEHANEPEEIAAVFVSKAEKEREEAEREERIRRRVELAARGPKIMEEAYIAMGIPWPPDTPPLSDEELKEAAFIEQFGENWWEA